MKIIAVIAVAATSLTLAACASTDVISKQADGIVIEANSAKKLDNATKTADRYCEKMDKSAVLERTEEAGKDVVAYFSCL